MRLTVRFGFGAFAAALLLIAGQARGAEYERFIDIDDEDDLYSLFEQGEISETTLNTLVEILQVGVNLDTASRAELYTLPNLTYANVDAILAYRAESGGVPDPAVLVSAGVLDRRTVAAMATFLVTRDPVRPEFATKGRVRLSSLLVPGEERVPGMALRARITTLSHLEVGMAGVLTRNRVGSLAFDPNRVALTADPASARLNVPKLFVSWNTAEWGAIAGTYRIGFGQRLTFDNTGDYTPDGFTRDDVLHRDSSLTRACKESGTGELASPCTGDARWTYTSPDWRWREGLMGLAAGHRRLEMGPGWLSAHGFASYQHRSVYQYQVYDRSQCSDPREDGCSAPDVFVRRDDPFQPTTRHSYQTIPDAFAEAVFGANATYHLGPRAHVGVTAYGATVRWLVPDLELDFQEWARLPYGGPYGAIGVDAAGGYEWIDLFLEITRSFDSMPDGGGGMGALLRATTSWGRSELEAAARYYDQTFYNPYGRPIAAADLSDGLRARDETGLRLKYGGRLLDKRLDLRAMGDLWTNQSRGGANFRGYARGDLEVIDQWRLGLWTTYQDKVESDLDQCVVDQDDPDLMWCTNLRTVQSMVRVRFSPMRSLWVSAAYQHEFVDDPSPRFDTAMRQDASAWLAGMWKPVEAVRLRGRLRWLNEAISDNTYGQQFVWGSLDAAVTLRKGVSASLRYDLVMWLDERPSTFGRQPSPEHWVWLGADARF